MSKRNKIFLIIFFIIAFAVVGYFVYTKKIKDTDQGEGEKSTSTGTGTASNSSPGAGSNPVTVLIDPVKDKVETAYIVPQQKMPIMKVGKWNGYYSTQSKQLDTNAVPAAWEFTEPGATFGGSTTGTIVKKDNQSFVVLRKIGGGIKPGGGFYYFIPVTGIQNFI